MKEEPKEERFWPETLAGKAVSRAYLYGSLGGISMGIVLGISLYRLFKGV